jgi:uncharacterized protein YjbI with pentapeptide repeats
MTQEQLNKIIERHQHYLNKDINGWESMRADLSYKNLSGLDLRNANLYRVNLRNANLRSADLRKANLRKADLRKAALRNANLRNADLRNADFRKANLSNADLRKAALRNADLAYADLREADLIDANLSNTDLREANLSNADLSKADLNNADLGNADLSEANLYRANLRNADLREANLSNADLSGAYISEDTKIDYPIACPETGSFIGYKKASYGYIVKLQICKNARRSSATTKKCRCSKALVLAIENIDGSDSGLQKIASDFDHCFIYRIGEIVEVLDFDDNRWHECAPGIHFFTDRQDAVAY